MNKENQIYDLIGVGIGPFNLSLAALSSNITSIKTLFFDENKDFNWHKGMMIEGTTLHIPFIADLVTFADPTNPLSFLNYLKLKGNLYAFYIRENFSILRREYNQYCQWVVSQLTNLKFNYQVVQIKYYSTIKCYEVHVKNRLGKIEKFKTRRIVLGTGKSPYLPEKASLSSNVIHSSDYLKYKREFQKFSSITIIGSGQSAAEILYDLLKEQENGSYSLNWLTKSARFSPMEYSKLTLELTSPEYVNYFYNLDEKKKEELNKNNKLLYKGINFSLINDIYDELYIRKIENKSEQVHLQSNVAFESMSYNSENTKKITLELYQHESQEYFTKNTDAVIFATGYRYCVPSFLSSIKNRILWDEKGRYKTSIDNTIDINKGEIFVQNASFHSHGFTTPDLGMVCYRNAVILNKILDKAHFKIEDKIAFQHFK